MNKESSDLSRKIKEEEMISFESLAELTGFPVETIKGELLSEEASSSDAISLGNLREAMLKYLSLESFEEQEKKD